MKILRLVPFAIVLSAMLAQAGVAQTVNSAGSQGANPTGATIPVVPYSIIFEPLYHILNANGAASNQSPSSQSVPPYGNGIAVPPQNLPPGLIAGSPQP